MENPIKAVSDKAIELSKKYYNTRSKRSAFIKGFLVAVTFLEEIKRLNKSEDDK